MLKVNAKVLTKLQVNTYFQNAKLAGLITGTFEEFMKKIKGQPTEDKLLVALGLVPGSKVQVKAQQKNIYVSALKYEMRFPNSREILAKLVDLEGRFNTESNACYWIGHKASETDLKRVLRKLGYQI